MHPNIQSKTILYSHDVAEIFGFIMVPDDIAKDLVSIHAVLNKAKTWGDVREMATAYAYEEIQDRFKSVIEDWEDWEEEWEQHNKDSTEFDAMSLYDIDYGYWPPKAMQYYENWMPKELYDKYVSEQYRCDAYWLCIDVEISNAEFLEQIKHDFARYGYTLVEDEIGVMYVMGAIW